ncbi:MAG TPA: PLP-dependent aminotransferase family protein [Spirochaetales bacterium]|nr:PLP-dependent aminotransferase family protein [Spirochaetales bacterium]
MFLPRLDRLSREPLARQLADRILEGIETGALAAGDALPSTRRMADWVGVSRFTVERAYDELWAQGYVEARSGSYTRVRARPPRRARAEGSGTVRPEPAGIRLKNAPASLRPEDRIGPAAAAALAQRERMRSAYLGSAAVTASPPRSRSGSPSGSRIASASSAGPVHPDRTVIDFYSFHPDSRLFPSESFKRAAAEALRSDPGSALSYGNPAGHPALRERIAKRMREHGIDAGPDNVLVTEGALHAVDLAGRLLAAPGRSALCEDPTYPGALAAFGASGLRPLPVPDDDKGMDPAALRAALDREGRDAAFVYLMPSFRNPTGRLTGQRRREELLSACLEARVPILEDGFEEELGFLGNAVRPLASMDPGAAVLYVGTLSKSLFPGIRLGWIAASEEWIRPLTALRAATSLGGNMMAQAAAAAFWDSGAYATHLRRVCRAFSRRLRAAQAAAARHLPASARLAEAGGGYLLWVRLPGGPGPEAARIESEVMEACRREGVAAAPGSPFYAGTSPGPALRLCIAGLAESEIEEGFRRLGAALVKVFRTES